MKAILQGWNFLRILRLLIGVAILVQGIVTKDSLGMFLGVLFGGMAVANVGCCGASGCAINPRATNRTQNVQYEELDIKK